jgi:hypothetical protein
MIAALLDHIWQSSLFAGAIALLTLFFRRNSAGLRFWLWFAASVKFLVPFAVLAMPGEYLSRLSPAPLPRSILAIQPAAEKLSARRSCCRRVRALAWRRCFLVCGYSASP